MKWRRWVTELRLELVNKGPLHIGAQEDDLLIDEDTGKAIIPGTSLAGALRSYAESIADSALVQRLFGRERTSRAKENSLLIIHDALSEQSFFPVEVRPGVRIHRHFGSVDGKGKFERTLLPPNLHFYGRLIWTADRREELQQFDDLIIQCLRALDSGVIRLGKYKSSGGGDMRIGAITGKTSDLFDPEQLFEFLQRGQETIPALTEADPSWLDRIRDVRDVEYYRFELTVRLSHPILIRGLSKHDPDEPDASPIRYADGRLVVPGSSFKGALRQQVRRILRYLDKMELEKRIFGTEPFGRNGKPGENRQGAALFADAEIHEDDALDRQEVDYYGIRVDKFTGGVIQSALKQERTVRGKVSLCVHLRRHPTDSKETMEAMAGALTLALRDLAEQGFAMGSGAGSGRGYMKGERLDIVSPAGAVSVRFTDKTADRPDVLNRWLTALQNWHEQSCGSVNHGARIR